ncbi:MAG: phage integrase SAM-like domain-containing protein [Devosia sp.]
MGTDSLSIANELKWSVIKELKDVMRSFRADAAKVSPGHRTVLMREAAEIATVLRRRGTRNANELSRDVVDARVTEILGAPVDYETIVAGESMYPSDVGMRVAVYDPVRTKVADDFMAVALHGSIPLESADADYRKVRLKVSPRTADDHDRALRLLTEFCIDTGRGNAVAGVDEDTVTDFIAHLENAQGMAARTIKKYVSRLNLYFAYLRSLRQIKSNPWKDAQVFMPTQRNSEKERHFTEREMVVLLTGGAKQKMQDLMMIGALTGARLDAIVDLKVGDIVDGKAFRFKPQKREPGERYVPIHPELEGIVRRRTAGKKPEDDLFPEYPVDPTNPLIERSFRASKHFTTYRRSVGVDDVVPGNRRSRVNYHSFRRWFITKGQRTNPPVGMIEALVGHVPKGITLSVYSEGPEMLAARRTVRKITLPPLDGSPVTEPQAVTPRN